MIIIAEKVKNTIRSKLREKIEEISKELGSKPLEEILKGKSYVEKMLNAEEKEKTVLLESVKKLFEEADKIYAELAERKAKYHINGKESRKVVTIFGELKYERNYYVSKEKAKEYFYFVDEFFKIEAYARYDRIVKGKAIEKAIKHNQKRAGELLGEEIESTKKHTSFCDIPRQTIHRWIKEWEIPEVKYAPKEHGKELFVMVDEKYIHEQVKQNLKKPEKKRNFIMGKAFVAFTRIEEKDKRRTLCNRFVFLTSERSAWNKFMDTICQVYDFEKIKKISVLSDAAKWIISGIGELRLYEQNAVVSCLCEFHFKQKINRITTDSEIKKALISCVQNNQKAVFKNEMEKIKHEKPHRLEKLNEYEKYILGNWAKIHSMKASKYKSSMEAQISHHIANTFSSRPKAYSRNRIESYLKLQEYSSNGIDVFNLYLKTCDNFKRKIYSQEELDFSIFEDSQTSVFPIIQKGLYTGAFNLLKNLTH